MRRRWRAWLVVGATTLAACSGDDAADTAATPSSLAAPGSSTATGVTAPDEPDVAVSNERPTTEAPTTISETTDAPGTTTPADAVVPEGFDQVGATVTLADGTVCELCLWLANTPERRRRGLMGVTNLGGADGMAFLFDGDTTSQFWMRGTPMPLSIAFFAADGAFVSTRDMEPCLDGPDDTCERYGADGPYTTTIEFPLGDVARLGIGPGSVLEFATELGCADATS